MMRAASKATARATVCHGTNEALGMTLRILSTFAFALMGVCVKALGDTMPLGQVVFFRSAVALRDLVRAV